MNDQPSPPAEMSLFEHLGELRKRLIIVSLSLLAGASVAYSYTGEIFSVLAAPFVATFPGSLLIGTGPAEAFMLKIKVALFAGALLTSPIIFQQLWGFVAPGLLEHERVWVMPFIIVSTTLFLGGACFCYFAVLPICFQFFSEQYQSIGITPTIRVTEHLSMMIQAIVGFGAIFELPVAAFLLARSGAIDHRMMLGGARHAIVIIFIVSAVLTPPDVLTQFLMAIPLLILYLISIGVVYLAERKDEPNQ